MKVRFDPTFKLSDVITSLSFVLAILALVYSQQKDRVSADREQVAEARAILSNSLAKLERWSALSDSIFDEVQPTLVQTTEIWAKQGGDVVAARDYLWREFNGIYSIVARKMLDEKISGGYVDLYRLSRDLPTEYRVTLEKLDRESARIRAKVLADTEQAVLSFEQVPGTRVTAQMGNKLRASVSSDREELRTRQAEIMASVYQRILASVSKKDSELLAYLRNEK